MTSVLAPIYSARDEAITQRPTSTAILAIDSEDRFKDYDDARAITGANRSPYSFSINKNQSLMNGFFTRVGVTEVVFPWVIPNINIFTRGINVTYDIGAGPQNNVILLELGFYTPSQIAAQIQTAVRALAPALGDLGSFTMTYGVLTSSPYNTAQRPIFEYGFTAAPSTIAFSPATTLDPKRKQLFDLLGFTTTNSTLAGYGKGNDTYCQTTRYIDIVCSQLTANQSLKDTMSQVVARDVLCRVYVGDAAGVQSTVLPSSATFCPPGCMPTTIYKDFAQPKQIQWIPNQPVPGYLQFDVYDDAGFALSDYVSAAQGNGANWSMTMLVTEN
jgi:hypothetical protein